jgi:hypothetical protein
MKEGMMEKDKMGMGIKGNSHHPAVDNGDKMIFNSSNFFEAKSIQLFILI